MILVCKLIINVPFFFQVGPKLLVLGQTARENGLGVSLLERLQNSYTEIEEARSYSITLCNNYRCLPEILDLPSSIFYESSLKACAKVARLREYSLSFICSSESDSFLSLCENMVEARIIIQEVEALIYNDHIDTTGLCIMSPSQRQVYIIIILFVCVRTCCGFVYLSCFVRFTMCLQVSLIRQELRCRKLKGIKVLSSYQMQGWFYYACSTFCDYAAVIC